MEAEMECCDSVIVCFVLHRGVKELTGVCCAEAEEGKKEAIDMLPL
jgi:hypothetical protein